MCFPFLAVLAFCLGFHSLANFFAQFEPGEDSYNGNGSLGDSFGAVDRYSIVVLQINN